MCQVLVVHVHPSQGVDVPRREHDEWRDLATETVRNSRWLYKEVR